MGDLGQIGVVGTKVGANFQKHGLTYAGSCMGRFSHGNVKLVPVLGLALIVCQSWQRRDSRIRCLGRQEISPPHMKGLEKDFHGSYDSIREVKIAKWEAWVLGLIRWYLVGDVPFSKMAEGVGHWQGQHGNTTAPSLRAFSVMDREGVKHNISAGKLHLLSVFVKTTGCRENQIQPERDQAGHRYAMSTLPPLSSQPPNTPEDFGLEDGGRWRHPGH